jgi:hypothetical protein
MALRVFLIGVGALVAVWLLGALAQGVLLHASLTARKLWVFELWFEKFGLGVVVGFVLGFLACLGLLRRPVGG